MVNTANFKRNEFVCPCCGKEEMQQDFINRLQRISDKIGNKSMVITSGWRCQKHNDELPGSVPDSPHLSGYAADIYCGKSNSSFRWELINAAMECGITRIGIKKTMIHLDIDPHKPLNQIWVY